MTVGLLWLTPLLGSERFRFWWKTDEMTKNHHCVEIIVFWRNLAKSPVLKCKRVIFTTLSNYASAVLGIIILSVRLSVTCVLCDETKELTVDILLPHERVIILVFWHQQSFMDDVPFYLKFVLKVTYPFEKHWLRLISAYNISTIRASEKVFSYCE